MPPNQKLIDELFLDKVRAARAMDPGEKMLDGPRLFDYACRISKDGIRHRNPSATDAEIHAILIRQLQLARQLE